MRLKAGTPNLIWASGDLVIDGQPLSRLPILIDGQNQPVLAASNWFRSLAISGKISESSLVQYAKTIRNCWTHVESLGKCWTDVDDRILLSWRNKDRFEGRLEMQTCNDKLSVVYRYYWWAQSERYVSRIIGPIDWIDGDTPPITVSFQELGGRRSSNFRRSPQGHAITSNLLFRVPRKPSKHVPTAEEMDRVYVQLSIAVDEGLAVRNALILNWAELEGLRRAEILSLNCDDIPPWEKIYRLQEDASVHPLRVVGKGAKARILPITHELLAMTRDYIDGERREVLDRLGKSDPGSIFISHRSAQVLSPDYVTNIQSAAFKKADVDATLHRARARFLSRIVEQALDEGIEEYGFAFSHETILLKAAEAAGHAGLSTLRYYLDLHLKRRSRQTDAGRVHSLHEKELAARRALEHSGLRSRGFDATKDLVRALATHDRSIIKAALDELNHRIEPLVEDEADGNHGAAE